MLDQLIWFWSFARRSRSEPSAITSQIETEGGTVISTRQLGAVRPSPFDELRPYTMLWEFTVHYGPRRGHWLVRTSRGSDVFDWVWSDDFGNEDLPAEMPGAKVDNQATPVPYGLEAIVVWGGILACVAIACAVYWLLL